MRKIILYGLIAISFSLLSLGLYLGTKFKSAEVELGMPVTVDELVSYGTTSGVSINLDKVNVDKVGEYPVVLKYLFVTYDLTIKIVDKTPPTLEVQNLYKPLNYVVDVNDFIINVSDKSEYEVDYHGDVDTSKYGEYVIDISAKDVYGNIEKKSVKLIIGWVKNEYSIEDGNNISIKDLVYDVKDSNTILQSDLDEINKQKVGIYYLKSTKDGSTVDIKIEKTRDVTPPNLVLKKVTIYSNRKINSVNDFVSKAFDKCGKVTLNLLSNIDYKKIGKQTVSIEAVDINDNKVTKETTLTIIKDTVGPKISGLSKLTVNKGTKINYKKGVSSYDDNTGKCDFTVDSSGVNTSKYGTYHAIYSSSDSLGNKTTSKRVIIVNHDKSDTDAKVKSVASSLPKDAEKIRDYVRNNIKYNTNWGGNDPVWYGLTNKVGNCFVHARIFEELLKAKGFTTKLIWTTDKTHYWNMVYLNNKWVHMDATPSSRHNKYSIMNDDQRYERLQGRNWDRSLWPKAE